MNQKDKKEKIVIWGTGKLYEKWKARIRENIDIVAFIDNMEEKKSQIIDGIGVYSPNQISELQFDYVFVLTIHYDEVKKQLRKLQISDSKVYSINQIEKICDCSQYIEYSAVDSKQDKKLKLLVFSHALSSSGAQNVLLSALKLLANRKYSIVVISKSDGILKEQLLEGGISVIVMDDFRMEDIHFKRWVEWADYILINTIWLYYVIEELDEINKKVIWWIHESGAISNIGENRIHQLVIKANIEVYAVSKLVKKNLEEKCQLNGYVHELIFGIPEYTIVKKRTGKKIIFACIGVISPIKGQDIFLEAIDMLPQEYRNKSEYWIIGRGDLNEREKSAEKAHREIKLLGEVNSKSMKKVYEAIDIVVCCSREEAMSVVVAEGFMNRKLAIVSSAAGIADYMDSGVDGIVFKTEDSSALMQNIIWVIDHQIEAQNMAEKSRQIYDKYFSMKLLEDNFEKILR